MYTSGKIVHPVPGSTLCRTRFRAHPLAEALRSDINGAIHVVLGEEPLATTPDTQFFRAVFSTSPIGIAVETLEGQPLFVNPAFCSFLGFSEEELRNKHCVDFSPREDAEKDWALFQQLRAGLIDHYQLEKRYFRRDGSVVWGRLIVSSLKSSPSPFVVAMVEDITEKRKAEEARFRHAAIVESSNDAIISKNLDGVIVSWNAGAEFIFGYTEAEAIGQPITILIPPELQDEEKKILEALGAGKRIEHYETKRLTKTGRMVDVSLTIGPIKDSTGCVVGFSKLAHDITQRKRAEEAVKEREAQYRRIVETTNEGVWLLDAKLRTSYVNRQMVEMLGYEPGEMVGRSVFDFYFHEDVEHKKQVLMRRQEGMREQQLEERLRRRDGSELWVQIAATPVFKDNGEFDGALAMMSDITEERTAKEALRRSEERLRLAQWAAHIGTFDVNLRTGVDIWQPELEALYGLPPGGFGGTLAAFEDLIHPQDRERVIQLSQEMMRTGQPAEAEWRVVWPDGSLHWIASRGQVLIDESGEPSRMLGVNLDVTERKRADEALSGMTRKLVEAQEQERARIARELHDDINQRLAMLAVGLGQLQSDASQVQTRVPELRRELSQISEDVQALSHDLHSSQLEHLGAVAGMKSWCKEFGQRQKMEIDCRHDVRSTLQPELGLCLFRVLQEALHNAAKHSEVKRVEVQFREELGEIHLIVSDSGRGFDVEAVKQGKGLGLTSMRERVRLVGGTIGIESTPMSGTTIHVRVPLGSEQRCELAG